MTVEQYYRSYYAEASFERVELFRALRDQHGVRRVLYPASSIHLATSLVFPEVVYIDNFPQVARFFEREAEIQAFLQPRLDYQGPARYSFLAQDYTQPLPVPRASFDLLLSQYGGLISQPCKPYLRPGGLLLVNDCHGDARAAFHDPDYELIGAATRQHGRYRLINSVTDELSKAIQGQVASPADSSESALASVVDSYLFRRVN